MGGCGDHTPQRRVRPRPGGRPDPRALARGRVSGGEEPRRAARRPRPPVARRAPLPLPPALRGRRRRAHPRRRPLRPQAREHLRHQRRRRTLRVAGEGARLRDRAAHPVGQGRHRLRGLRHTLLDGARADRPRRQPRLCHDGRLGARAHRLLLPHREALPARCVREGRGPHGGPPGAGAAAGRDRPRARPCEAARLRGPRPRGLRRVVPALHRAHARGALHVGGGGLRGPRRRPRRRLLAGGRAPGRSRAARTLPSWRPSRRRWSACPRCRPRCPRPSRLRSPRRA